MAGIYIHIPFCRQACHYCNFHFSTSLKNQSDLINAITKELSQRRSYLKDHKIETIYFGGGTPSVLIVSEIGDLISAIHKNYTVENNAEITLEANPEDLTEDYIKDLKSVGINRLSIGIQSFSDADLKFMNRSHDAAQAKDAIYHSLNHITDISVDLIFGGQYTSTENWTKNLETVIDLEIPHLSCYALTIEDGTAFGNWIAKNKIKAIEDNIQKDQFVETSKTLQDAGYEHYEISNYAKPNKYARHNTNYWKDQPYLGIGPSAHSYDGKSRQWNISNNHKYLEAILENRNYSVKEKLTEQDKYNEYILTSLRTKWGCQIDKINLFDKIYQDHFNSKIKHFVSNEKAIMANDVLYLTDSGKLFADQVTEEFFYLN